jgi:hypothetical protein
VTSFGAGTTERVSRNPRSDHGTDLAECAGPSSPDQLAFFACDARGQAKPPKLNSQQEVLKGTTFEDIFR